MPKSRVSRKKLFREFSKIDPKFILRNDLKYITFMYRDAKENHDLNPTELDILLFTYDLEFWTIDHLADAMMRSKKQIIKRYMHTLKVKGYIYNHFERLTPSHKEEDMFFRDETRYNYRVRYAITQKARLLVSRMYRKIYGEESFKITHTTEGLE
jgi:hypothetical protein